jgi:hypothetical protein
MKNWTLTMATLVAAAVLSGTPAVAAEKPTTVIHTITIQWKEGTTVEQKRKAIGGVETAAKMYPGIKRIWLRSIKVQGKGMENELGAVVMEFESEQSLKDYVNSKAQKAFYEVYQPYREESVTHDITN